MTDAGVPVPVPDPTLKQCSQCKEGASSPYSW